MNHQNLEQQLLKEIEQLKYELNLLKKLSVEDNLSYSFSNIKLKDLKQLFKLERKIVHNQFDEWFNFEYHFKASETQFLKQLIHENQAFIKNYNEEDLKANFIIPLLNYVHFKDIDKGFRGFYNESLIYQTEHFTLNGQCDFYVAQGLFEPQKPYFFIQEFKKEKVFTDPEPQLLAELISAVELNQIDSMQGAYIVGSIWNFVILEKINLHEYQYVVSQNFDSTKLDNLKIIYKNLHYIKHNILNQ